MNKIMNIDILNKDGQLMVTSRQIAEDFGKEHKNVLQTISNLVAENSAVRNMVIESYFENRGKQYPEYLLTRDGFTLLAMGFTGPKALEWKLKYIEAFNKMEQALKENQVPLSVEDILIKTLEEHKKIKNRVNNLEDNMPLFNIECKELQDLVKKVGTKSLGGYRSKAYKNNSLRARVYQDVQFQIKREFGVNRYEAIKRAQLEEAKKIVSSYKLPIILQEEISLTNNQVTI